MGQDVRRSGVLPACPGASCGAWTCGCSCMGTCSAAASWVHSRPPGSSATSSRPPSHPAPTLTRPPLLHSSHQGPVLRTHAPADAAAPHAPLGRRWLLPASTRPRHDHHAARTERHRQQLLPQPLQQLRVSGAPLIHPPLEP